VEDEEDEVDDNDAVGDIVFTPPMVGSGFDMATVQS